jgi:hypothetical protein
VGIESSFRCLLPRLIDCLDSNQEVNRGSNSCKCFIDLRSNSVGAQVQRLQHRQGGHKAFHHLGNAPADPNPSALRNRHRIGFLSSGPPNALSALVKDSDSGADREK